MFDVLNNITPKTLDKIEKLEKIESIKNPKKLPDPNRTFWSGRPDPTRPEQKPTRPIPSQNRY